MSEHVTRAITNIVGLDGAAGRSYDHEISLIDATEPSRPDEPRSSSPSPSWRKLARNPSKTSVKGHLAKKRYSKWQEKRYPSQAGSIATSEGGGLKPTSLHDDEGGHGPATEAVDFAHSKATERGRAGVEKRRQERKSLKSQVHEIDILYENQRGSFFCGIPLYSHSSLLPTDPSPWVNKFLHDSPVNITNAQVPDPSWEWAWKTWYVDMSYDVDEEGWQYSFSFGQNFAWHGSHPWFHSFVRRRRWLRKRVKRSDKLRHNQPSSMDAAHHLTTDYFTIHSKRDRSPVSVVGGAGKIATPYSVFSYPSTVDMEESTKEIKNIASLLKALKFATIDREKLDVAKRFVNQAEDELVYLPDHLSDVMSFLVFRNSRRQLLSSLQKSANEARQHRQQHEDEESLESDAESRRIDNLLAAVEAAKAEIGKLEFWGDRDQVLEAADDEQTTMFSERAPRSGVEDDPVHEIKGISEKADLKGNQTSPAFRQSSTENKNKGQEKQDKGKGRATKHINEDDQIDPAPRLRADQVFIPDED